MRLPFLVGWKRGRIGTRMYESARKAPGAPAVRLRFGCQRKRLWVKCLRDLSQCAIGTLLRPPSRHTAEVLKHLWMRSRDALLPLVKVLCQYLVVNLLLMTQDFPLELWMAARDSLLPFGHQYLVLLPLRTKTRYDTPIDGAYTTMKDFGGSSSSFHPL